MDAAYEAELVRGLADDTPDTLDPPADQPGARKGSWTPETELPGVSQFFVPELAGVLDSRRGTAPHTPPRAGTHRENPPPTRAAPAGGGLEETPADVPA